MRCGPPTRTGKAIAVLILKRPQAFGVRHVETAVLGLSFIEGRTADPVLAANIHGLRASFLLAQNPNDLLFREAARLHVHPPQR